MNTITAPTTSRGEQAKNQLIAAAIAQFGEFGLHATTRDIAAQAGQNIAAITYYFGSKEDLYMACAQWIADFISHNFRPHVLSAMQLLEQPQPDKKAIRELIHGACRHMCQLLTSDETLNLSKFISREQLSPTAAYALIHQQVSAYARPPHNADRGLYRTKPSGYRVDSAYPRPVGGNSLISPGAGNHLITHRLGQVRQHECGANWQCYQQSY